MGRRVKSLMIGREELLNLFGGIDKAWDRVELHYFEGFPEDLKIVGIESLWDYQAIGFLVEHESFPDIPEGQRAPRFEAMIKAVSIKNEVNILRKRVADLERRIQFEARKRRQLEGSQNGSKH